MRERAANALVNPARPVGSTERAAEAGACRAGLIHFSPRVRTMLTNYAKWPMESESTALRPAPQRDGLCRGTLDTLGLVEDSLGMLVETARLTLPAASLPPEEYEARILAHQERIEREMSRLELVERGQRRRGRTTTVEGSRRAAAAKNPKLPSGLKYADLKIVSCARCSRTLLGESQEPLRAAAVAAKVRSAANFPPPVGARLHGGRPYCAGCAATQDPP